MISHLLFTKDVILFAKVYVLEAKEISRVLYMYIKASSQLLNSSNLGLIYRKLCDKNVKRSIYKELGTPILLYPSRYLGIPNE